MLLQNTLRRITYTGWRTSESLAHGPSHCTALQLFIKLCEPFQICLCSRNSKENRCFIFISYVSFTLYHVICQCIFSYMLMRGSNVIYEISLFFIYTYSVSNNFVIICMTGTCNVNFYCNEGPIIWRVPCGNHSICLSVSTFYGT